MRIFLSLSLCIALGLGFLVANGGIVAASPQQGGNNGNGNGNNTVSAATADAEAVAEEGESLFGPVFTALIANPGDAAAMEAAVAECSMNLSPDLMPTIDQATVSAPGEGEGVRYTWKTFLVGENRAGGTVKIKVQVCCDENGIIDQKPNFIKIQNGSAGPSTTTLDAAIDENGVLTVQVEQVIDLFLFSWTNTYSLDFQLYCN